MRDKSLKYLVKEELCDFMNKSITDRILTFFELVFDALFFYIIIRKILEILRLDNFILKFFI